MSITSDKNQQVVSDGEPGIGAMPAQNPAAARFGFMELQLPKPEATAMIQKPPDTITPPLECDLDWTWCGLDTVPVMNTIATGMQDTWTTSNLTDTSSSYVSTNPGSVFQISNAMEDDVILQNCDPSCHPTPESALPQMTKGVGLQDKLSNLLGEMKEYQRMLIAYHVAKNGLPDHALNGYPIGDALYLMRHFCELQKNLSHTEGERFLSQRDDVHLDIVAAMMIATCYITMIRIIHVLLGHLEHYLAQIKSETFKLDTKNVEVPFRGLKLKDVLSTHHKRVLFWTRSAVDTLQDDLKNMDQAIVGVSGNAMDKGPDGHRPGHSC